MQVTIAPIASIRILPQMRTTTGRSEESLTGLRDTIQAVGILEPLIVRACDEPDTGYTYDLVAGERRILAATMAGLTEVPITVQDGAPRTFALVQAIENLQREDLSALEIGEGLQHLTALFPKRADLCKAVGKSPAWVSKHLSLTRATDAVRTLVAEGLVTDLETALTLDKLGRLNADTHPKAVQCYRKALDLASEASLSRAEALQLLDAAQALTCTADADADGEEDQAPAEKPRRLVLSREDADYLAELLSATEAKSKKAEARRVRLLDALASLF